MRSLLTSHVYNSQTHHAAIWSCQCAAFPGVPLAGKFQRHIFIPLNTHLPVSSQVLEDTTGVRRVVVTPQSPECYPPSYSPALSPTHHLPPYLAHPHFIPNSHSFYPPVSPGELPPHQYYQHHLPPMYGDPGTDMLTGLYAAASRSRVLCGIKNPIINPIKNMLCADFSPDINSLLFFHLFSSPSEIIPVYGMSNYIGREETYSKPQPKKIKEQRQLERQNRLNSPPSTLYKSLGPAHNGYR